MKKYKQFILGLVTGAMLFSGAVFAANELNIKSNPYPVLINGQTAAVSGYNIDGFTYLKLADFKKAGLKVVFNETDSQIEITSVTQGANDNTTVSGDVYNTPPSVNKNNLPKVTYVMYEINGNPFELIEYEDKTYITPIDINRYARVSKYNKQTVDPSRFSEGLFYKGTNEEVIFDKSQLIKIERKLVFEYKYFKNIFIPSLKDKN